MAPVPRRTYQVLHIAQKETTIEEEPDVTAWVKRTKMNTTHPFIIWARGDISELAKLYEDLPSEFNSNSPSCGITFGRAMIKPSVKITTSGRKSLPRYLVSNLPKSHVTCYGSSHGLVKELHGITLIET